MKPNPLHVRQHGTFVPLLFATALLLSSCYSVRVSTVSGTAQPDPLNNAEGFYRGMEVHTIDTITKLKITDTEVMAMIRCPEGIYTIEYRVTFGDVLRSGFTLGKRRKIRVKYVCIKESND